MISEIEKRIRIVIQCYLCLLAFTTEINPQTVYDTLYLHPDTTAFYNRTAVVVGDIGSLAVLFSVDSTWKSYQIEKILPVIPNGLDTLGFEYYQISLGEIPLDSIIYTKMVFNHPTFPEAQEIVIDPPLDINGFDSFYISGLFNVSISNSIQAGIHGVYAYWGSTKTWMDYFPVYFNVKTIVKKNITIIDEDNILPKDFILYQNYPNPFNPSTTISYALPFKSDVQITIFDLSGSIVKSFNFNSQSAGYKTAVWDGRNNFGESVSSGIYIYTIKAVSLEGNGKSFNKSAKLMLLK